MSFDTAQKIVDFAFGITPPKQKLNFGFFGGEPLLCFDLIEDITSYIRQMEKESQINASINITTNGTLLNEMKLNFIKNENIDLCISIDGPASVHNLNRVYNDGGGSFKDVIRCLYLTNNKLPKFQVNAVYSPNTINYLLEIVDFFRQINVFSIHLNPNINSTWGEDILPSLKRKFMELANYYIQCFEDKQEIAINLIDSKLLLLVKGGYEDVDKCSMGEREWAFAPSGNIYPCERFIGEDNNDLFCLGNINTDLNLKCICSMKMGRGNHDLKCKSCNLEKYCMNWCGCTNYYMSGHIDSVSPFLCENEKAVIKAAKYVFVTLRENQLFLDHLMKYYHDNR